MPTGPGKYDDLCTEAREQAKAKGAVLIIIQGEKGSGFCVQGPLSLNAALPRILREMADEIENDIKGLKQ